MATVTIEKPGGQQRVGMKTEDRISERTGAGPGPFRFAAPQVVGSSTARHYWFPAYSGFFGGTVVLDRSCVGFDEKADALRLVVAQRMLRNQKMNPIETLYFISPVCIMWMIPAAILTELPTALRSQRAAQRRPS